MKKVILAMGLFLTGSAYAHMPIGEFCIRNKNHLVGYSIQKDGTVFYINNFAGMPNPHTQLFYVPTEEPSSFEIVEVQRDTGTTLATLGPFQILSSTAFTDQVKTYELGRCSLK